MANASLSQAKDAKNDEFYTELTEIQKEVSHYVDKFSGKVVFCNCDDPFESNFVKYFLMNFNRLGLKELIATGYKTSTVGGTEIGEKNTPYALRVTDTKKYLIGTQKDLDIRGAKIFLETEGDNVMTPLAGNPVLDEDGNQIQITIKEKYIDEKTGKEKTRNTKQDLYYEAGDFRSDTSLDLLKQSDIVVTNPPFSLFREYVATLIKYNKQFLIIGNINAITYKEIFPLIKDNGMWIGYKFNGSPMLFRIPKNYPVKGSVVKQDANGNTLIGVGGTCWFTNIDHPKRHQKLPLDLGFTYKGHEDMYPKYDNYDAINVDRTAQIPCDYEPCWYKCTLSINCKYAQSKGQEDNALCENQCNGEIGVPISFLDKHCPEQFEIIANGGSYNGADSIASELYINCSQFVNVERERERERETEGIQANCHSQATINATEFSEFQSHSSINIAQNNSELLGMNMTYKEMADKELQRDNLRLMDTENINVFSYKKCNGIMGVPISFLDKYCPEQFNIMGITSGRDEFDKCVYPTKKYINPKQHSFKNGKQVELNGSKMNTRSTLLITELNENSIYYTADNSNHKLQVCYARILIKRKGD